MRQKTIVYANTIDYDHPLQQRPHHIMNLFAKNGWKVYYVNQNTRTDKVRDRINENLEVYHNFDVFCKRVPEVDVYFSSWSWRYVDLEKVKAKVVVYDSLDNFEQNESEEVNMINAADVLIVTSDPLYEIRQHQHDNIHIARNACFAELGQKQYEVPEDLKPFKKTGKPILLFSGALASGWCDLELVEKIAKKYQVVVVGLTWGIEKVPNGVHYLGAKKYDELQAYYQHCDVSLLPFKRCQVSDYSSPIKSFEAMSHGKPTVSTDIPEALLFKDVILCSSSHGEFITNIDKAIKLSKQNDFIEKCIQTAKENTWEQRFNVIENAIYDFCNKRGITL